MSEISIVVDGNPQSIAPDQRPTHLYESDKSIVVCKINGELRDLWTELKEGDKVEGVSISSPEGLQVLRHSTAHVMAQAVQQVFRRHCPNLPNPQNRARNQGKASKRPR